MKLGLLFSSVVSGEVFHWSEHKHHLCGNEFEECIIPAGDEVILDANMDVGQLTVNGKFTWNTAIPNLTLNSSAILVNDGGTFECGTPNNPMNHQANIFIKSPISGWNPWDQNATGVGYNEEYGSRFFVGTAGSTIYLHGRELKSYALHVGLSYGGRTTIPLNYPNEILGWQVGDEIAIATNNRDDSSRHVITEINEAQITFQPGLPSHRPSQAFNYGGDRWVDKHAEVINLTRTIRIYGHDAEMTLNGFHMGTFGWEENKQSIFDVRYVRVQNCGQNNLVGRHCFNFSLKKTCPFCHLKGLYYLYGIRYIW